MTVTATKQKQSLVRSGDGSRSHRSYSRAEKKQQELEKIMNCFSVLTVVVILFKFNQEVSGELLLAHIITDQPHPPTHTNTHHLYPINTHVTVTPSDKETKAPVIVMSRNSSRSAFKYPTHLSVGLDGFPLDPRRPVRLRRHKTCILERRQGEERIQGRKHG